MTGTVDFSVDSSTTSTAGGAGSSFLAPKPPKVKLFWGAALSASAFSVVDMLKLSAGFCTSSLKVQGAVKK